MIILIFTALLSSCVTAARKGIGQVRPETVEISSCPTLQGEFVNVSIIVPEDMVNKINKRELFNKFKESFLKQSIKLSLVSSKEGSQPNTIYIKLKNLDHSFLANSWTLEGTYIYIDSKGKRSDNTFTIVTHKTFGYVDYLTQSLSDKISSCSSDD